MWQKSFWSKNTLLAPLLQKLMSLERNSGPMTLHVFTIRAHALCPRVVTTCTLIQRTAPKCAET